MDDCFATPEFLRFTRTEFSHLLTVGGVQRPIVVAPASNKFKHGSKVAITPICFSGGVGFDPVTGIHQLCESPTKISAGFIQTRDELTSIEPHAFQRLHEFSDGQYITEYRTNYVLDLSQGLPGLLSQMKKDSRSRVRKILAMEDKFHLVAGDKYLPFFSDCYDALSSRNHFHKNYRFEQQQWQTLITNSKWSLFTLLFENKPVAACVVGEVTDGYDYTFMASTPSKIDFSRALLIFLYNHLGTATTAEKLYLGGGIKEHDALASYKVSMGGQAVKMARYKFLKNDSMKVSLPSNILFSQISERWPV